MLEVTKNAPQQAITNLGAAFKRFFAGEGTYPRLKKKGQHDSFCGWVRMHEPLRFNGKVRVAVVSCTADRWFVSLKVEGVDIVADHQVQALAGGRGAGGRARVVRLRSRARVKPRGRSGIRELLAVLHAPGY